METEGKRESSLMGGRGGGKSGGGGPSEPRHACAHARARIQTYTDLLI